MDAMSLSRDDDARMAPSQLWMKNAARELGSSRDTDVVDYAG